MNGKQLKNSILQWAIQGKLVPQDPNDESASVLLEKIRQEKERLIKEKKIKRDKNASIIYRGEDNSYYEKILATGEVKCIDEEIPFEVPQGWEWCRLRNLCTIFGRIGFRGYTKSDMVEKGNGAISISPSNMKENGNMDFNVCSYISWYKYEESPEIQIQINDVLIVKTGSSYGKTCIIKSLPERATINPQIAVLKFIGVIPAWLTSALNSPHVQNQFNDYVIGTSIPTFSQEKLGSTLLPCPPMQEQQRISLLIKNLMYHISHYDESQKRLAELNLQMKDDIKKSLLQEAIQGKLVPQIAEEGTAKDLLEQIKAEKQKLVKEGKLKKSALATSVIFRGDDNKYYEQIGKKCVDITEDIPFSIPANWKWVRIRNVFQLNPKNEADNETLAAFIPMEKISAGYKSDFTFDLVKWGNIKKGFTHFANGDVAFAKITPCFQNRKSAIFHDLPNGIGAGTTELKVLRPYGNTIDRWYLLYFLESPHFIDEATFKGTANQQRIVVGYLEDKLFPLPTQKEQQRIVAQIEKLFEQLR